MERKTLIRWADTRDIVEVTIGIGEWDEQTDDDNVFFWMPQSDYQAGYSNGEWTILQIEEEPTMGKWHLTRPSREMNDELVVICADYCDLRSDFQLARIQFIELYNGTIEPYYHVDFKQAWCYSVAAKELLSNSSYTDIAVPGGWGATICWLPVNHVK